MTKKAAQSKSTTSEDSDPAPSTKAVIRPAALWPQYNVDRARAELIAMELLTQGVSQYRVRHITKLSSKNVRRLAAIVAEQAANPPTPRLGGRTPVRQPHQARPVCPAGSRRTPTAAGRRCTEQTTPTSCEPVQMALALD